MDINFTTVIMSMLNFLIIVLVAKHFFFDKVKKVVDERENEIKDNMESAEEDAEKARVLLVENQKLLNNARNEGKKIIEENKKKADKLYQEIIDDANKEAKSIRERAQSEIQLEKEKAEYEIKKQVVDLAVMISAKALEESIDEEKHRKLINEFIDEVS